MEGRKEAQICDSWMETKEMDDPCLRAVLLIQKR